MAPIFLDLEEVLEIHQDQIHRYGGRAGLRDLGLLESALAMPHAGVRGRYLHEDLPAMAAAYLFHLAMNHPFVDGNKRTAAASALVFLEMNGVPVRLRNDRLHGTVAAVAEGRLTKEGVAELLRKHAPPT